jgi:heme/copper-type cytochrome/quinol oxidase subunit 3
MGECLGLLTLVLAVAYYGAIIYEWAKTGTSPFCMDLWTAAFFIGMTIFLIYVLGSCMCFWVLECRQRRSRPQPVELLVNEEP